jgi:hypothetical protein
MDSRDCLAHYPFVVVIRQPPAEPEALLKVADAG